MPSTANERRRQPHHPGDREQQREADEHRQRQAPACAPARAAPCGSLPARIEMKTMLSMPRTISSTVRVRRAIQPSTLVIQSNIRPSSGRRSGDLALRRVATARPRCRGPARAAWRDTARRPRPGTAGRWRRGLQQLLGRRRLASPRRRSAFLVLDAQRVEKAAHHRPLVREVIRDSSRAATSSETPASRPDAAPSSRPAAPPPLRAELDPLRDGGDRLGLFEAGLPSRQKASAACCLRSGGNGFHSCEGRAISGASS